MTIYSLDILLFLFGTNLLFHVQFYMLLLDLHTDFSGGRSGGLVFPSLSEFSIYSSSLLAISLLVHMATSDLFNCLIYSDLSSSDSKLHKARDPVSIDLIFTSHLKIISICMNVWT